MTTKEFTLNWTVLCVKTNSLVKIIILTLLQVRMKEDDTYNERTSGIYKGKEKKKDV